MPHSSRILMLYTGGTIGMVKDTATGSLQPFDFEHLLEHIPELETFDCQIDTDSLDHPIDSSNIKPEHWVRLANRIARNYEEYDGFVILHGSDTMAYTASALSFLLRNLSKPVILTGSQLPIGITRSDARENILTTIEIALARREDNLAMVPEVAVYFEYDLFRGNRIHKISTEDFEAFQSINYPRLAEAGVHIRYNSTYITAPPKDPLEVYQHFDPAVAVLTVFPGMLPGLHRPLLEQEGLKGLILRSFGSGNIPTDPALVEALRQARKRGVEIVNVSQCNGGAVRQGRYEASRALLEMGVISGSDMTFEAALTKLMFLLGQGYTGSELQQAMTENLRGELSLD